MASTRRSGWGKWLFIILLVGGVTAAAVWYYKNRGKTPTEYQTVEVTRGDVVQAVTATGQLNPVVSVQVGSQISGRIQKINADYNSIVKSNQVIAEIDPSTYQVNVHRAEAQVANSKANRALAQVQAKRAEELFKNKLIPAADHDTAVAQLQQAEAQVMSDEAQLENAKVDLSRCTIYAPVDGVVISRNVDVGQTVAASFNTPTLFLIANDLTKMQIDALVSEADIGGVEVGQAVNFTVDAYPYRTFRGKVSQIRYGSITNQNVVNYDCVVEVSNPDKRLLPGMTANISIVIAERKDVLKVSNAALRFRPPEVVAERSAGSSGTSGNRGAAASPATGAGTGGGRRQAAGNGERAGGSGAGRGERRERAGREGSGAPAAAFGQEHGAAERPMPRVVYVLKTEPNTPPRPEKTEVTVGITDGTSTEVISGLEEGTKLVTAVLSDTTGQRPAANPFGGGMRRF